MKLKQIGSKKLHYIENDRGIKLYFSYEEPIVLVTNDKIFVRSKFFSSTTTSHKNIAIKNHDIDDIEFQDEDRFEMHVKLYF